MLPVFKAEKKILVGLQIGEERMSSRRETHIFIPKTHRLADLNDTLKKRKRHEVAVRRGKTNSISLILPYEADRSVQI